MGRAVVNDDPMWTGDGRRLRGRLRQWPGRTGRGCKCLSFNEDYGEGLNSGKGSQNEGSGVRVSSETTGKTLLMARKARRRVQVFELCRRLRGRPHQ